MAGEYDDQLEWPFVGKINIKILNWKEDEVTTRRHSQL